MATQQKQFRGWKDELQHYINKNNMYRDNGKVASGKTQEERAKFLFVFFHDLRNNGFAVDPHNLKTKHIEFITKYWITDTDYQGKPKKILSPASIQNYLSMLRLFCRWIGKNGMIGDTKNYYDDPKFYQRSYAAIADKSVEITPEILGQIRAEYEPVYYQLMAIVAFGLRKKESLFIRPHIHFSGENLFVVDGAKNGKERIIPIETDEQRWVAERLKQYVGVSSISLMEQKLNPKQAYAKQKNICYKYGIKTHGIRAKYILDFMVSEGLIPLIRGGEVGQLPKEQEMEIRLKASARLGHNRVSITTAYSGAFTETGKRRAEKANARKEDGKNEE